MEMRKSILMLGTRPDAFGGIASVVQHYESEGFLQRKQISYLPTHCTGKRTEKIQLYVKAMSRVIYMSMSNKVELAHIHVAINASFWRKYSFLLVLFVFRVPSILHIHAGRFPEFYDIQCGPVARRLIRFAFTHVDRIIVVSNELNRWVRDITGRQGVTTICNPAIVQPANESVFRTSPTLIFLGHIEAAKGAFELIDAMAAIVAACPDARLQLCGDGQVEDARAHVRALALENNVEVMGWVGPKRREQLLQQASIFVLPSHFEGLPMSLLEAMGSGLPVVATAVGGVPEAVTHEVEGLLVAPGDVAALTAAVLRLLACPEDRLKMGLAGRAKVEARFSRRQAVTAVENLYEQLISTRSTTPYKHPPGHEPEKGALGPQQVMTRGGEHEDLV